METLKRAIILDSDVNNNEVANSKRTKAIIMDNTTRAFTVGQIKELHMLNFMCHKNFSIRFYPTHMQLVTGSNGSGKSTIANAICLCLGAQARTTGRTSNVQSFIRKGETSAEITITLANEGSEAFKPELYGTEIRIVRKIGSRQSEYTILGTHGRVISRRKDTIDEILQALSISPENPLCVLHQDIAKTFLIHSDSKKKYQFYMKASQLDQIKQAYEQSMYTVQLLTQRVHAMKQKHVDMLRELEPLEQAVRKIELRRDYEEQRQALQAELRSAQADQIRQELLEVQHKLEQIQATRNEIDTQTAEQKTEVDELDQKLRTHLIEKNDLEQDADSLRRLSAFFSKQNHAIRCGVHSLTRDRKEYRTIITEVELKQIYVQQQLDERASLTRRPQMDEELLVRQGRQLDYDQTILSLGVDIQQYEEQIRDQQQAIEFLENELMRIDQDPTNVYGSWMSGCLKDIQNDQRFQRKPIGPIGHYIHCTDAHWTYAVEKHLASVMPAFICASNADEQILLEILSSHTSDHRPPIYIRAYSDHIPDISGTLEQIKRAHLRSFCDVLKIDHPAVECALIDLKQIEATILLEDLREAARVKKSGILNWNKVDRRVKQVVEAWTHDGTNVKLDKMVRIYTSDKQAIQYLSTDGEQARSTKELQSDIRRLQQRVEQAKEAMHVLQGTRQTAVDRLSETIQASESNREKIIELKKELDQISLTLPTALDGSLSELQEKARYYLSLHSDTLRQYDASTEQEDESLQRLADITKNHESVTRKLQAKTEQLELITEQLDTEQSTRDELRRKLAKLVGRSVRINKSILRCEAKLKQLNKKRPKKSTPLNTSGRSVRDVQHELDTITNYLKVNEDTNEQRREMINEYRTKREAAREYKQTYERCYEQIEHLKQFINKRQEGFLTIADRQEYFLRSKFQKLMEMYDLSDCNIKINHKREELEIMITKDRRNLTSLSGGERSISTFCFLLALWQSVYQPFRLLDEIDIYMDNETLHSSLDILYERTSQHSSSQHIIFTPQAIDLQSWDHLDVPVFSMPTPKRSTE